MAQAARQSLRMQKELKLLITDPPHGASFPSLSDDSSLTSIDAHFKGPEGTVYADGVFKIKIQIPERYPFQPPMVTFATPIYHPNIDTGGRICLDILNLPPKGSWQPSLNISTVLTSIGLLLSEPNPDDGLMHDASREYKYNRQAFDQKARSMTDKYARAGASGSSVGSQDSQAHICPSISKADMEGSDASKCVIGSSRKLSLESLGSSSKQDSSKEKILLTNDIYSKSSIKSAQHEDASKCVIGSSRKLSLESLGSSNKQDSSKEKIMLTNDLYSKSSIKSAQHEEAKPIVTELDRNQNKQEASKHKLSLRGPVVSHIGNCESTRINMPSPRASISATENPSTESHSTLPMAQAGRNNGQVSYKDEDLPGRNRNCTRFSEDPRSREPVKTSQGCRPSETLLPALSMLPNEVSTRHTKTKFQKNVSDRSQSGSNSTDLRRKTGAVVGLKSYFEPIKRPATLDNEKENLAPSQPSRLKLSRTTMSERKSVSENGNCHNGRTEKQPLSVNKKPSNDIMSSKSDNLQLHLESPLKFPLKVITVVNDAQLDVKQQTHKSHCEESTGEFEKHPAGSREPETTIVLDSEDSEDENVPARSRLVLARKRLALKRKRLA